MTTVLAERSTSEGWPLARAGWLALAAALAFLYVPTYIGLAQGLWRDDEYAHGPLVLAIFAWLVWRERSALASEAGRPSIVPGALLTAIGLVLYALGRSQSIALFEAASHVPLFAGLALLAGGWTTLRRLGFAIAFLFFAIPLPGFILAAATGPLKELVSATVVVSLHALGYPASRDGVVIALGGQQLLVADACSGLSSIFALTALTALYAHLTGGLMRMRAALLLGAVVPVAILANVLRVLVLCLVAFHLGEPAAEGVLHGVAGMLIFAGALTLLLGIDRMLPRARVASPAKRVPKARRRRMRPARALPLLVAALAVAATAMATPMFAPVAAPGTVDLEGLVPVRFGDWRIDRDAAPIATAPDVQQKLDRIYGDVLSRTYVNSAGERMMLTVAYGGDQSDALKAHRQEVCYTAQGFEIRSLAHGRLEAAGREIPVTRFLAVRGERSEPVTYWFTMGDRVVLGRLDRLRAQLAAGFGGRIPDGMLVRISSISADAPLAYAAQRDFADALLLAIPADGAVRVAGKRAD
jgi:exosortase B